MFAAKAVQIFSCAHRLDCSSPKSLALLHDMTGSGPD
jgi:hypothetical protein